MTDRLAVAEGKQSSEDQRGGDMDYQRVSSSSIAAIAYERSTSTLGVRFQRGYEYSYFPVPESVFREILSADSKGQYFNARIRSGGYTFERIQ